MKWVSSQNNHLLQFNRPVISVAQATIHSQGSRPICRHDNPAPTAIEYMHVDLRGTDIAVSEQLLYGSDDIAKFQQLRGKGVAECIAGHPAVSER